MIHTATSMISDVPSMSHYHHTCSTSAYLSINKHYIAYYLYVSVFPLFTEIP